MSKTRNPNSSPGQQQRERLLLARMAQGEVSALEQLYGSYHGRLKRFLLRMGCPENELDAVCNEVMLVAWNKADTYQPDASRVSTWLFGIARFKALKVLEQDRRRDRPTGQDFGLLEDPVRDDERLVQAQWLQVALAELPDEQRQVIELTFLDGLSYREIGEILGCPENTVKTRMFHARRKLRKLLESRSDSKIVNFKRPT